MYQSEKMPISQKIKILTNMPHIYTIFFFKLNHIQQMYLTESDIKIVKDGIRKNNPEIPFI